MRQCLSLLFLALLFTGCSYKGDTATISSANKEGLIDNDGEVLIKPIYKRVYRMKNLSSNEYTHPHYINFHWFHVADKKYAVVKNIDNKHGIINKEGELQLKVIFDSIGEFFNGYAKVEVNGKVGLIDEDFEIVLKPIFDDIRNVLDDSIIVKNFDKNRLAKYGCLNTGMKLILPLEYDMIYLSHEGRMRVEKEGLWGFIDTQCNIVAKPMYTYVDNYSKGFARVQKGKLWTYLNHDGKPIERETFNGVDNFN